MRQNERKKKKESTTSAFVNIFPLFLAHCRDYLKKKKESQKKKKKNRGQKKKKRHTFNAQTIEYSVFVVCLYI